MANRNYASDQRSVLKGLVRLYAYATYTSSGNAIALKKWNYSAVGGATIRTYSNAPTTTGVNTYQTGEAGILSIARTATGAFTLTLQDKYQRLVAAGFSTVASSGVSTLISMGIDSATDVTAATPIIKVKFSSATATAADPADADSLMMWFDLQNSTEP